MAVTNLYAAGATPRFIALGADDQSIRLEPLGEEQTPQHLPKFYILANKGSQKDHIVDAAGAKAIYGDDVFDQDSIYFRHPILFASGALQAGQMVMLQRLKPRGVGRKSNLTLYADIIKKTIPNYKRDSKGNITKDNLGNPEVDPIKPTKEGLAIKWITEYGTGDEPTQAGPVDSKHV